MSGTLGYGANLPLVMSVRNVGTNDIEEGDAVAYSPPATAIILSGDNMVNTSGGSTDTNFATGSHVMEATRQDEAGAETDRFLGIAYNDIPVDQTGHLRLQ